MTILGVLQNQWFKDPARVKAMLARQPEETRERLRRKMITVALFAGCLTGRRLRGAFGDLCDDIVWENSSHEIGDRSGSAFPANVDHLRRVIHELQPFVVIGFGRVACEALESLVKGRRFIRCPHPAARGEKTTGLLDSANIQLEDILGI